MTKTIFEKANFVWRLNSGSRAYVHIKEQVGFRKERPAEQPAMNK